MTPPKPPKMAVPVKFQAMEKNALSNRFTPFESICTTHSAILSVGDDMRIDSIDADYQQRRERGAPGKKKGTAAGSSLLGDFHHYFPEVRR